MWIDTFHKVTYEWIKGLEQAITGDDLSIVENYLNDSKAIILSDLIQENKNGIYKHKAEQFDLRFKDSITIKVNIVDQVFIDVDFDSEINVRLNNQTGEVLIVEYNLPNGSFITELRAYEMLTKSYTIKGFEKSELLGEVILVKPLERD